MSIDALVIGGGVQGLAILNRLKQQGYSAALVTNAPLGAGQTLHSHGILNSGYPYPRRDLRASLERDWLPFAERSGLEVYGNDEFYVLTPPGPFDKLRKGWDACGYDYERVAPDRLPSAIREGDQFREGAGTQVVKIDEYTFPKRQLIRLLAEGVKDRILYGSITKFRAGKAGVESVDVEVAGSGRTVTLKPGVVITATGTGTRKLVGSLVDDVARGDAWRSKVLAQVEDVACRNTHMICIRAPKSELPAVNLLVLEHRLMIISASVDHDHDRRSLNPGVPITWYVTPIDPAATADDNVPDTAQGRVQPRVVLDGLRKLLKVFPSLRSRAEDPDSRIEFAVYAGYKQDVGDEKNRPVCKRLDGLPNVLVTLPSLIPGAFVNAKRVLELVQAAARPSRGQPALPGATGRLELGQVTENTDEVEWMDWKRLVEAYPGIGQ